MKRAAILIFAAIALAALSACSPRERPAGDAGDGANGTAAGAFAAVPREAAAAATEAPHEAENPAPRIPGPGRFAGAFEFYGYEIVLIRNMESPINAQEMAGDRIVVEMGADGYLRFSHVDVATADRRWETFRRAGSAGWHPSLAAWLASDDFRFSPAGDSAEILYTGGYATGLASLAAIRLWYKDEDTIIYEEWRWRGALWRAVRYREITFRLIYRRARDHAQIH